LPGDLRLDSPQLRRLLEDRGHLLYRLANLLHFGDAEIPLASQGTARFFEQLSDAGVDARKLFQ
jgi:hypothetical protein